MPVLPCPNCKADTPKELQASNFATVNYYRCSECGHVWTTDKRTNAILEHITPLDPKKKPEQV